MSGKCSISKSSFDSRYSKNDKAVFSGKMTPMKLPDSDALFQSKIEERDRRQHVFNSTQYKQLLLKVKERLSNPTILDKYFMGCPVETF